MNINRLMLIVIFILIGKIEKAPLAPFKIKKC